MLTKTSAASPGYIEARGRPEHPFGPPDVASLITRKLFDTRVPTCDP
jgi:hypothetical protein